MLENSFSILERRLNRIETLLIEVKDAQFLPPHNAPEVGGIELAQQVTRLSKPRIYALVSSRGIPHAKRGNKLYFTGPNCWPGGTPASGAKTKRPPTHEHWRPQRFERAGRA